jgi:hypothetical protein
LDYERAHPGPVLRLRAHIVLQLADSHTWVCIDAVLFCSSRAFIARWKRRFQREHVKALLGLPSASCGLSPTA